MFVQSIIGKNETNKKSASLNVHLAELDICKCRKESKLFLIQVMYNFTKI